MPSGRWWTTREVDGLRKLAAEGVNYPRIGEILGRSVLSIQMKAWALGLSRQLAGSRPWTGAELREFRGILARGGNQSDFARRRGRTVAAVYTMARRIRAADQAAPHTSLSNIEPGHCRPSN